MNFENTLAFTQSLDQSDPLRELRQYLLFSNQNGRLFIYLCSSSLGIQSKAAGKVIDVQLNNWGNLAVEGWFASEHPCYSSNI